MGNALTDDCAINFGEQDEVALQPELQAVFQLTGVHARRTRPGWRYPGHSHSHFELLLLHEGLQHIGFADRTVVQRVGDAVLIVPHEEHSALTPEPSRFSCIHFDVDDLELRRQLCMLGTGLVRADAARRQRMHELMAGIIDGKCADHTPPVARRLHVSSRLFDLLATLVECIPPHRHAGNTLSRSAFEMTMKLARMIERQVENGEQETSIESAIRKMGYAPDYAGSVFRQIFGMSARQYRSTLKLKRAKLLLLDTTLSIWTVGTRLGYTDGAHFSRQFKRWTGLAPHEFRSRRNTHHDDHAGHAD